MCCRTYVHPLVPELAIATLGIGKFSSLNDGSFERYIAEEKTTVRASLRDDTLMLSLGPAVSSMEGHHDKRIAASVMYEIAVRYAEKIGGVITQEGINVPECKDSTGGGGRLLASYPETRFNYENLCTGFKVVFLGG